MKVLIVVPMVTVQMVLAYVIQATQDLTAILQFLAIVILVSMMETAQKCLQMTSIVVVHWVTLAKHAIQQWIIVKALTALMENASIYFLMIMTVSVILVTLVSTVQQILMSVTMIPVPMVFVLML